MLEVVLTSLTGGQCTVLQPSLMAHLPHILSVKYNDISEVVITSTGTCLLAPSFQQNTTIHDNNVSTCDIFCCVQVADKVIVATEGTYMLL